jgi:probable rRNA maturation factor
MPDTTHKDIIEFIEINSVTVEHQTDHKIDLQKVAKLVGFLRAELGLPAQLGVDITFVSEDVIEDLHLKYMNEPGPTDVLSFPMDIQAALDTPTMLGDIVICPEFARQQLDSAPDLDTHLEMLVTHSMLHLIGHDHPDDETRAAMFSRQDRLLAAWRASTCSSTNT